ncbi:DUF1995 family protein [Phormidium sp. CLA17]|uniref:DUF1995 family protein n=1 Tax=Leptolyngbya sp. Cla-17 TaxID=2803751 RepID=UPI001491622E|nr:DUF1995 family protein [Leptolyngbya sp. Cla-17]MBM0741952.1 DUF1995 family protein [Leptolyngbya sp. Cla-17]
MVDFPTTLDEAIAQAQTATQAALAAGYTRLQVELAIPELKPMQPAHQFLPALAGYGAGLKIFFTDAGAAALARRDWGDTTHSIQSIDIAGARQTTLVEELATSEDQAFMFVAPSSVEVLLVEQICNAAGDRPVLLFNPRLEDVGAVGIGYTARKLRERFLNTIEPCYFLKPLDGAALLRCYPSNWQVWAGADEAYTLIAEEPLKPSLERLDEIFLKNSSVQPSRAKSMFAGLERLLKALRQ